MVQIVWSPDYGVCPHAEQLRSEAGMFFTQGSRALDCDTCVQATTEQAKHVALALRERVDYTITGPPYPGILYVGTSEDISFLPSLVGTHPNDTIDFL